ncbi:MAG: hypothetical protein J6Q54_04895 [Oscillospiraceae bacterium]|nr:hypothetical protein [Oscillospiraceae bacterium]
MELIRIDKKNLKRTPFHKAAFIMYKEPGAMGENGVIYFITWDKELYGFSYISVDITLEDVLPLWPDLANCRFGVFGKGTVVPRGWRYIYTGTGTHLLVEESMYDAFVDQTLDYTYSNEIGIAWKSIAERLLSAAD